MDVIMKFKFLYLGNKTLEERERKAFRVLNCEEDLSEEIESNKFLNNKQVSKENRICFNRNGNYIDFIGMSCECFIEKLKSDKGLFERYLYNQCRSEEFNVIFLDSLTDKDFYCSKELINIIDEFENTIDIGVLNKVLFIVSDYEMFQNVKNRSKHIGSRIICINELENELNSVIDTFVDFISYSELVYNKLSFENKFNGMNLIIGDSKQENCSGEIIMSILKRFSLIQGNSFFELILLSADNLDLEEVALIEDALKEYIPFNSELIIKQLTNKVLGKKIAFMLFSR